jgi:LemA protein
VVIPALIVIGIIVLLGLFVISLYNRFVQLRNRIDNSWAQVDVQLKRRYDLIPNLIETVKGYAAHERETFEQVTLARAAASNARTVEEQGQAENMLTGALRQLFAVAEAYPELRASEQFQQLQTELSQTEGLIATARQIYNDTVLNYNNAIQVFPGALIAGPFGFSARPFFNVEEVARDAPRADFRDMPGRAPAAPTPPPAAPPAPPAPPTPPPAPPATPQT